MEGANCILTIDSVNAASYLGKKVIESAVRMAEDKEKDKRLQKQECQSCFYGPRIGGRAMTTALCAICGELMTFSSTCKDKLCPTCAREHGLCKHCGADIDLKNRTEL
jgi:hypothetical protein